MGEGGLARQIEEAEAHLARLKRQAARATCVELGHAWKHVGGCRCGCFDDACCSVPVHECERCGDCDYGQNAWAEDQRAGCRDRASAS